MKKPVSERRHFLVPVPKQMLKDLEVYFMDWASLLPPPEDPRYPLARSLPKIVDILKHQVTNPENHIDKDDDFTVCRVHLPDHMKSDETLKVWTPFVYHVWCVYHEGYVSPFEEYIGNLQAHTRVPRLLPNEQRSAASDNPIYVDFMRVLVEAGYFVGASLYMELIGTDFETPELAAMVSD